MNNFLICLFALISSVLSEEACYSYGGGHVYPQETTRSTVGQNLVTSKAQISKPAPDWESTAVVNGEFKELKLKDYRGKYVVFFFYPLDFTFVCPTEIIAFSDRVKEFHAINTEVIACSVDSPFTHLAWMNTPRKLGGLGPINIPLLSDLTHQISKDYGVYLEDLGHTLRGLFIIDDKGTLRQITMNDLPVGRSVDETLRLVQAFQYTDKHGEVCPAGWKPGINIRTAPHTTSSHPTTILKYLEGILIPIVFASGKTLAYCTKFLLISRCMSLFILGEIFMEPTRIKNNPKNIERVFSTIDPILKSVLENMTWKWASLKPKLDKY